MAMRGSLKAFFLAAGIFLSGMVSAQIIDHNCVEVNLIPHSFLEKVRKELRISYGHTSHGSQIISGMEALKDANPIIFAFSTSRSEVQPNVLSIWDGIPSGDLGNPDRESWAENTMKLLDGPGKDRNVVMWSWCGQVSSARHKDIETYLRLMSSLEKRFPKVKFVYMTGHLDGSGEKGNLHERNEQIREYCKRNNKLLFDFADIESYSPGGNMNFMKYNCNDACDFVYNGKKYNWAQEWLSKNPEHGLTLPRSAAHTQPLNALLKGRAFWWMMAVISGWVPPEQGGNTAKPVSKAVAPTSTAPAKPSGISRLYRFDRIQDFRPWVLFGSDETLIPESGNGMLVPSGTPAVAMYRGLYTIVELEFKARLVSGSSVNWYVNTDWKDTWNPKVGLGGVANENGCILIVNGEIYKYACPVRMDNQEHRYQIVIRNNRLVWGIDRNIVVETDIPASLADRKGSLALGGWKSNVLFSGVYFQAK